MQPRTIVESMACAASAVGVEARRAARIGGAAHIESKGEAESGEEKETYFHS